ncbi:MAG: crosslink repair DNA glycosylase YcaQ family protein [Myxococcaceae bacterium]
MPVEGDRLKLQRVKAAAARRLLLSGQGLLDDPTAAVTPALLRERVEALGLVQVDSINVVARAHDLTMMARLDGYRPGMLSPLLEETRELFEQWTHDASIVPSRWYHHWHHRFERDLKYHFTSKWWRARLGKQPERVAKKLLRRIEKDGPISSGDLEAAHEPGGWWQWTPEKATLEYLWRTGRVAVTRRVNFSKYYDLPERVLPRHHALPRSAHAEHLDWAMGEALDRLGFGTPTELARYFHAVSLADARRWASEQLKSNALIEVELEPEQGKPLRVLARPDFRERLEALPEAVDRVRLLSPFDPIVRDRSRALRLFGFDYRFEAFTPAPKRQYGYYVFPILQGERLIGRTDLKLLREDETLAVQGVWWERKAAPRRAFADALERMAAQLGAKNVKARR